MSVRALQKLFSTWRYPKIGAVFAISLIRSSFSKAESLIFILKLGEVEGRRAGRQRRGGLSLCRLSLMGNEGRVRSCSVEMQQVHHHRVMLCVRCSVQPVTGVILVITLNIVRTAATISLAAEAGRSENMSEHTGMGRTGPWARRRSCSPRPRPRPCSCVQSDSHENVLISRVINSFHERVFISHFFMFSEKNGSL